MKRLMHVMITVLMLAMLAGCGGGDGESTAPKVVGVAAAGSPLVGTVTLKDSSSSPKELSIASDFYGSFSFDVSGLTAPFMVQAIGTAGGNNYTLYSLSSTGGNCNINPLTHLAVIMANGGQDPSGVFVAPTPAKIATISAALPTAVSSIHDKLTPMFNQVGASPFNIITDQMPANGQGVDLLFDMVSITVANGNVSMVNKVDSGTILPATSIASGVLGNSPNVSVMSSVFTITGSISPGVTGIYIRAENATSSISSTVQTDAQGNFQLFVPNGSYEISVCNSIICRVHGATVSNSNISGLTLTAPSPATCPPGSDFCVL